MSIFKINASLLSQKCHISFTKVSQNKNVFIVFQLVAMFIKVKIFFTFLFLFC